MVSKDEFYQFIGSTIKNLREESGKSQHEIASALDLTRSSLAQIESARQAISAYNLYRVSLLFGIDPSEILSKIAKESPSFDKESASRIKAINQDEILSTLNTLRAKEENDG